MNRQTKPHIVCRTEALLPGDCKIVEAKGRSVGVFNVKGRYYALRNACPHQQAPLCQGEITGTTLPSDVNAFHYAREGEIIRCPWHGWEFDITTGKSIFNPHRMRVATYAVTVEQDEPDPSVEQFEVTVESGWVVVHV